jgi:hypothetical protein
MSQFEGFGARNLLSTACLIDGLVTSLRNLLLLSVSSIGSSAMEVSQLAWEDPRVVCLQYCRV